MGGTTIYGDENVSKIRNPVTLMVISDSRDANSLPGSGCGLSKTGASICQGHAGLNQH